MGGDSDERTLGSEIQFVATELDLPDLRGRLKDLRVPSKGGALNHLGSFVKTLSANFVPFHFHPLTWNIGG